MNKLAMLAVVAAIMAPGFGGAAMAASTCADRIAEVKKVVADAGGGKDEYHRKESATIRIREAEEALARSDEAACVAAIGAANAAIVD